jgi:hypothetical protein
MITIYRKKHNVFYYNHKYIKREGEPGNYTYIYRQPKGGSGKTEDLTKDSIKKFLDVFPEFKKDIDINKAGERTLQSIKDFKEKIKKGILTIKNPTEIQKEWLKGEIDEKGKEEKSKTSNIDTRDINEINKELAAKADNIRNLSYNQSDAELESQMKANEKYKDGYDKLTGIKGFAKRKDLQDYYYKYMKYSDAKKELEKRAYEKRVEGWKKLPKPNDTEFQKSKKDYTTFMEKYKKVGKREQKKMQQEHDDKEKKVISDFLETFKDSNEYARSMLGNKMHDFIGRESEFGDTPEADLKQAELMYNQVLRRAEVYGLIKTSKSDVE